MLAKLCFSCAVLLACASFPTATAQVPVNVRTISAQTEDAVAFKISVPQTSYAPHQNIVVNYTVTNNSTKVVYLVLESEPRPYIDESNRSVAFQSPVKDRSEGNRYENDLVRILPRRSFSGKLVIPGAQVPVNPKSGAESWEVQVVFGYVFNPAKADIEELLPCKYTPNSLPCIGRLYDIAQRVAVGNLVIEVRGR